MVKNRARTARELLGNNGVDAFIFLHLPNIRYLCGFTGTDGVLIVTGDADCFLTDSRYTTQARSQVTAEVREYQVKLDGMMAFLTEALVRRVGFEAATTPYALVEKLRAAAAGRFELVPVEQGSQSLRGIKDEDEIAGISEAARISAEAFNEILPLIRPGAVEREIALELEFAMKRRGAEEKAFDFIVASGPRGALPHGVASDKVLGVGELVTVDYGARYCGYHSDETVTLALGEVKPELRKIFDLVHAAQQAAVAMVRPGVPLAEIDAAARNLIREEGYGDYFGHGLGHGVGLEIHEYPTVNTRAVETAVEGMVFTIEPGIYVPELGGVRIEDIVQVTADGCRRLTLLPKEFRSLAPKP